MKHGVPSDFDIQRDGTWDDVEVFAGLLKDFPPQSAFADPFGKITNLRKSNVKVDVDRIVIDFVDKLLHYQVDNVSKTMEVTGLLLINFLQNVHLVIPRDSQLSQLLLQTFRHRTVVGCTIGGHAKKFICNIVVTQRFQDDIGHVFAGVMIAQTFEGKIFLMIFKLVVDVVESNP